MKTFEQAWAQKEADGYQYGADALEQVKLGWQMAMEAMRGVSRKCECGEKATCARFGQPHQYEFCGSCFDLFMSGKWRPVESKVQRPIAPDHVHSTSVESMLATLPGAPVPKN